MSYKSVKYERPTRMSNRKCQVGAAHKSVKKACQARASYTSVQ